MNLSSINIAQGQKSSPFFCYITLSTYLYLCPMKTLSWSGAAQPTSIRSKLSLQCAAIPTLLVTECKDVAA